jgi:hypothetical protein
MSAKFREMGEQMEAEKVKESTAALQPRKQIF